MQKLACEDDLFHSKHGSQRLAYLDTLGESQNSLQKSFYFAEAAQQYNKSIESYFVIVFVCYTITHADSSRTGRVFSSPFVCLFFRQYLKNRCRWDHQTLHPKFQMFQNASCKPVYFRIKVQGQESPSMSLMCACT